jgi:hypothetical protein
LATLDLRPVIRTEYGLELLGDADGNDARSGGLLEVWTDQVDLTVIFAEMELRDAMFLSERSHRGAEGVAHLCEQDRRGDR